MTVITALLLASLVALIAAAASGVAAALSTIGSPEPATASAHNGAVAGSTGEPTTGRLATLGLLAGLGLLVVALIARAIVIGHAPWSNLHEFSFAFAAAVLGTFALLARSYPVSGLAPLAALLGAGLVGFGLSLDDRIDPLVPALQQPLLLTIHVGMAVLAYAVSGVAFLAAVGEIAQRAARGGIAALPSADTARAVGHRAVLIGFPILTIAIALGSVWANLAWRSYWSNDPKELAAAATWLVFGAYLHVAGRTDRWQSLAPWLIVLGFVGVLFTYVGAGLFFIGEHSYAAP